MCANKLVHAGSHVYVTRWFARVSDKLVDLLIRMPIVAWDCEKLKTKWSFGSLPSWIWLNKKMCVSLSKTHTKCNVIFETARKIEDVRSHNTWHLMYTKNIFVSDSLSGATICTIHLCFFLKLARDAYIRISMNDYLWSNSFCVLSRDLSKQHIKHKKKLTFC